MTEKRCTKCQQIQPVTAFYKDKSRKDGLRSQCKDCVAERKRQHRQANKEQIAEWKRQYYQENKEQILEQQRQRYQANKEQIVERQHQYYQANKEQIAERQRRYRQKKMATDPQFQLNTIISCAIYHSLKTGKEGRSWRALVPYSLDQLQRHLEAHFRPAAHADGTVFIWQHGVLQAMAMDEVLDAYSPRQQPKIERLLSTGMTWANEGRYGWHIDHIIPKTAFNFEKATDIDFHRCWALDNLQPLWWWENISKNNRLYRPLQPSLALAAG